MAAFHFKTLDHAQTDLLICHSERGKQVTAHKSLYYTFNTSSSSSSWPEEEEDLAGLILIPLLQIWRTT